MRAIGYTRVSTETQSADGLGMAAQRKVLRAWAKAGDHELLGIETDVASGKSTNGRHGLTRAIARVEAGEADGLVATKLDRIARSSLDFAKLLERARKHGWSLVVLDLSLDTSTPMGGFVAQVMASVAELERRQVSERTKAALAVARERGVKLGRPENTSPIPAEVREQIAGLRSAGLTFRAIADELTRAGLPSPSGRPWNHETVRRSVLRHIAEV